MKKKTKKIQIIDWLDFGSFPGTILFIVGHDYNSAIKYLKKNFKKSFWESAWPEALEEIKSKFDEKIDGFAGRYVMTHKSKGEQITMILCLKNFNFTDGDYSVLAHEILHLINFELKTLLDRDREHEAEAYTHTHIMMSALNKLRGN